ncbi:Protein of unknown function [Bacillus cereus]|nr:Protein of unknown function [Bacillus cereus]SCV20631.1 Protein of unknown function [Bacillus cereus]
MFLQQVKPNRSGDWKKVP